MDSSIIKFLVSQAPYDPIAAALFEDFGSIGDLTGEYFVSKSQEGSAKIVAKQEAVLAGVDIAAEVFNRVDLKLKVEILKQDGSRVAPGDAVLSITGKAGSILAAERVALNFIQRLSGVATLTRRFVDAVSGLPVEILDTRKTTPGLRALEKKAVVAGGGANHRLGLFDRIMVKDNHLLAGPYSSTAQSLQSAIDLVKTQYPKLKIELEADTLLQVEMFLNLKSLDWILLDNMKLEELKEAVQMRNAKYGDVTSKRVLLEASGGVNLQTVHAIAQSGVDAISVGALTHSAVAVDFSLDFNTDFH